MPDLLDTVNHRRSHSKVTGQAPSHAELLPLVAVAARVADHGALRPWRLIELRGDARRRLGEAMVEAAGLNGAEAARLAAKPLRAELLIAVVASRRESDTVAVWEQDAVAAGVAHMLSLLLAAQGWGVMWRSGALARTQPVNETHGLAASEELLGWLYVGGIPADAKPGVRSPIDPTDFLSALEETVTERITI
ncbi:nitroreductase [Cryobacterium sp. TMT1-62]|uniref:Putative NAD(P)H nitroreductase n=1 Tax=Cryobacterium sandaracinum TaxID=1259247 RepID=A0ABY2JBC0_9MICO|nr:MULTISPECIES: nitroreductase family protein [Cryobacterium]TFB60171.1 nitroreductase [Cryobacterium sp. Sr3]TFB66101.1 nitroreductase [Cryobacterium sp. Hz7]TFD02249.1 nitroreductase [Cryobacterium sandaracinum]TFD34953.1 nitroreductase [Cryobacterium sp. TMT1-62]